MHKYSLQTLKKTLEDNNMPRSEEEWEEEKEKEEEEKEEEW